MLVIGGVKIEQAYTRHSTHPRFTMVTLFETSSQWPFNPNALQDLSDKEILTHTIKPQEASRLWHATLLPCLPGYAYVGFRIVPIDLNEDPQLVSLDYGKNGRHIFGPTTDMQYCGSSSRYWTMFKFPIVRRLCVFDAEKINLCVEFTKPMYGKVEFLAQRFDDLLEEDDQIVYYYWPNSNSPQESGGWIVDAEEPVRWMKEAERVFQYPTVKFIYPLRGNADNNVI